MSPVDLGELRGSLLMFGGPYSNLQATEALQRRADPLGIPPGNIICTGDAVAYCAQPNETLQLIRDWGITLLLGNCEESLASDAVDCGCGFDSGRVCDVVADSWYGYSVKTTTAQHKEWMRHLPRLVTFTYENKTFMVVHGSVERINEFIFPSTEAIVKQQSISIAGVDGVVAGHCGLPFTEILPNDHSKNRLWHNPGAIGMPANDGTPQVWYAVWRPVSGQIRVEHHRLAYDAESAQQAMLHAGLTNGYAEALSSGLWPSMDVLPERERLQRGVEIVESAVLF